MYYDPMDLEACVQELERRVEEGKKDLRLREGEWPMNLEICEREIETWRGEIRTAARDQAMHLFCLVWLPRTEPFQL